MSWATARQRTHSQNRLPKCRSRVNREPVAQIEHLQFGSRISEADVGGVVCNRPKKKASRELGCFGGLGVKQLGFKQLGVYKNRAFYLYRSAIPSGVIRSCSFSVRLTSTLTPKSRTSNPMPTETPQETPKNLTPFNSFVPFWERSLSTMLSIPLMFMSSGM